MWKPQSALYSKSESRLPLAGLLWLFQQVLKSAFLRIGFEKLAMATFMTGDTSNKMAFQKRVVDFHALVPGMVIQDIGDRVIAIPVFVRGLLDLRGHQFQVAVVGHAS